MDAEALVEFQEIQISIKFGTDVYECKDTQGGVHQLWTEDRSEVRHIAMVKRKADKSLDEWVKEGEAISAATQTYAKTPIEQCATAERVQPQVTTEPLAVAPADVAATEDEVADWFWALLEQSGYERWYLDDLLYRWVYRDHRSPGFGEGSRTSPGQL